MSDARAALVTVIVPGFDIAPFVAEALESLRSQTFEAWRAILVDDGSHDETGALFDCAAENDSRFTVVHHAHQRGLGAARNTALDLVDTPLVTFFDADDRYRPDALQNLTDALEASGSEMVVGAYVRLRPDAVGGYTAGTVQPWVAAATSPARVGTDLSAHPALSGNIVAWSKLSTMDLWRRENLRFPEGKAYEDQVIAQVMYTRARGIDVIPDVIVEWRERRDGTSITQRKDEIAVLRDYIEALSGGIQVLDAEGKDAAAASRVRLILSMDVPALVAIATMHPDPTYRRELGAFLRHLVARSVDGVQEGLTTALAW